ncbi:hypothetical protein Q5P01_019486 [Channa striata]|uniref:Uncharacterized protein n=1 Tax=Channa striata TaxID=64152 RepID=A0AA88M3B5_CHASR|nr:hypothetical protein Q5P01_019486 [Channa striata]
MGRTTSHKTSEGDGNSKKELCNDNGTDVEPMPLPAMVQLLQELPNIIRITSTRGNLPVTKDPPQEASFGHYNPGQASRPHQVELESWLTPHPALSQECSDGSDCSHHTTFQFVT